MHQLLLNALDQVKHAKVQVLSNSVKRPVNLFEDIYSPDIQFNGFKNPLQYQLHLETYYVQCKSGVHELLQTNNNNINELKKDLDLARFEIKEIRKLYFPKNQSELLLNRVEIAKQSRLENKYDEFLKKKFLNSLTSNFCY